MKILHFSTQDAGGGAARASYRLHAAIREHGAASRMIVRYKYLEDQDVESLEPPPGWKSQKARICGYGARLWDGSRKIQSRELFNTDAQQNIDLSLVLNRADPVDVVCIHWVAGFLTTKNIRQIYERYRCPLLWVLMDQEPLTGGCYYSFDCDGYTKQCGCCPQLISSHENDRSRVVWRRKFERLSSLPFTLVAPTVWTKNHALKSSLFGQHRIESIPLALDVQTFRPFEQQAARDLLYVPQHKKVLFFGAGSLQDRRKGMSYLSEALKILATLIESGKTVWKRDDVLLLVAGGYGQKLLEELPFPSRNLGSIKDDIRLALAYQAADLFLCPSIEDAGPMMISESMLCGTPVVAFDAGGAPDLISTGKTGYMAKFKDSQDFAHGIQMLLSLPHSEFQDMRQSAHRVARERHAPDAVAERYVNLCSSLVPGVPEDA